MTLWPFLQDWADFLLRGLHVVAAIFWVGLALGFLRLNLNLKNSKLHAEEARRAVSKHGADASFETRAVRAPQGEDSGHTPAIWRAADDGFFRISRSMNPPIEAQPQIGWFRWEAYVVWLSGAALLVLRYFLQADLYLIDSGRLARSPLAAAGVAVGAIVVVWLVYDFLCKTQIGWSENFRRAAIFVLLSLMDVVLFLALSGRGAFIVLGAVLGTIMVANVAHVLVPNQRRMIEAIRKGEAPDESRMAASRQRALHNNYLVLPTLLLMLAPHYPLAVDGFYNWAIAILTLVLGASVRHYFIARHRGQGELWWTWALAAAAFAAIVALSFAGVPRFIAAAPRDAQSAIAAAVAPRFADAQEIVEARCVPCHTMDPVWQGLARAPKGVRLDTPHFIRAHARDIVMQSVWSRAMPPPGVDVGITDGERATLAAWLRAGAPAN